MRAAYLHLTGQGDVEPPLELLVSRVCQEFNCLPSEALREIEEGPAGLVWRVIEMRDFARAVQVVEQAERDPGVEVEVTPMVELVNELKAELLREMVARRKAESGRAE